MSLFEIFYFSDNQFIIKMLSLVVPIQICTPGIMTIGSERAQYE